MEKLPIWSYDPETFEMLYGLPGEADPDPLAPGQFLVPAHSTPVPPIEEQPGKNRHFDPVSSVWYYMDAVTQQQTTTEAPAVRVVTMRKAQLAMLAAGVLDDVEAALAGIPGDTGRAARIEWNQATEIRRDWPLVNQMAAQLGMSEAALDALFDAAEALP